MSQVVFVPVAAVQEIWGILSVMDSRGQQLSTLEEVKLQVNFDPDNLSTKRAEISNSDWDNDMKNKEGYNF